MLMPTTEISKWLEKLGVQLSEKRLSATFRNMFYCGLLTNKCWVKILSKGKIGKPLSPRKPSLNIQILSANRSKFESHKEDDSIPLKRTVLCDKCGKIMTGYIVKSKQIYYYKCNTKSCCSNRSAVEMHEEFTNFLKRYEINPKFIEPLKAQIRLSLKTVADTKEQTKTVSLKRKKDLAAKIDKLEERFVSGEIDKELFEKFKVKYAKEMSEILNEIDESKTNLSNHEILLDKCVKLSENISKIWASGDLWEKQRLQKIVFPEKIYYNTQKSNYRTTTANSIIAENARVARALEHAQTKNPSKKLKDSRMVENIGISIKILK